MKSTFVKAGFYTLVLLTSLATQASNSEHVQKASHPQENHHSQDSYRAEDDNRSANEASSSVSLPEPGSLALLGAGIIGLFFARREKV